MVHRLFEDRLGPLAAPTYVTAPRLCAAWLTRRAPPRCARRFALGPRVAAGGGLPLSEPERGAVFNETWACCSEAASAGLGVAISPRRLAAAWLDSGRLVPITDVTAVSPHSYYVTCATADQDRPEVADFMNWLRGRWPRTGSPICSWPGRTKKARGMGARWRATLVNRPAGDLPADIVASGVALHRAIDVLPTPAPASMPPQVSGEQAHRRFAGVMVDMFTTTFWPLWWPASIPMTAADYAARRYALLAHTAIRCQRARTGAGPHGRA